MKLLLIIGLILAPLSFVKADTVVLKNGNSIHGKVSVFQPDPSRYRVSFKNGGWMLINKDEVEVVIQNELDEFED